MIDDLGTASVLAPLVSGMPNPDPANVEPVVRLGAPAVGAAPPPITERSALSSCGCARVESVSAPAVLVEPEREVALAF